MSHVQDRVDVWLDPFNPQWVEKEGYQIAQSVFAQADGGLFGTGFGASLLRGPGGETLIPAPQTDLIYAVIVNEVGLVGACGLLLVYLLLIERGFKIAMVAGDSFSKLLASGLTAVFALQVFVIVGGVTRVIPLTGVTLPFVSYGGSSILANFVLVALLLLVSDRARRPQGAAARTGAAVNTSIGRLFALVLVLFALLVGFTSRWTVFEAEALRDNDNNRRELLAEQLIKRGVIRADNGDVLAGSRALSQERFGRRYPTGPLFAHAVGCTSLDRGRSGLEEYYNDPLTGRATDAVDAVSRLLGPAKVGDDLRTTLSTKSQKVATDALAARRAARRRGRDGARDRRREGAGGQAVATTRTAATAAPTATSRRRTASRPARR